MHELDIDNVHHGKTCIYYFILPTTCTVRQALYIPTHYTIPQLCLKYTTSLYQSTAQLLNIAKYSYICYHSQKFSSSKQHTKNILQNRQNKAATQHFVNVVLLVYPPSLIFTVRGTYPFMQHIMVYVYVLKGYTSIKVHRKICERLIFQSYLTLQPISLHRFHPFSQTHIYRLQPLHQKNVAYVYVVLYL